MAGRPGWYAGYRQEERLNEVPSHRDWCIFQVRVGNPGPLQKAKAITAAFKKLLTTAKPRHFQRLQTDKGMEFINSDFQALMKRHGIQHFGSESEQRAAEMEQFIRTIKNMIWTYLSECGTVRLVDVIQDLVDVYNHSRHRFIWMAQADV